jgi:chromatin remodeling complex protein RSC6
MSKKKVARKGSALKRPVKISTKLEGVIGRGPMARADVVKKIWNYIKKKNLQHPKNARCIILDAKLKTILKPSKSVIKFGKQTVKCPAGTIFMTDMTKQLNKHIESKSVKVNPSKASSYDYDDEDYDDDYDYASNPQDEYDDEDEDDDYDYASNPEDEYDDEDEDEDY